MRIGLLNSVIMNGGDAGIVYGTCDAISDVLPEASVKVFAHRAIEAARYYPDVNLAPMVFDTWPRPRMVRAALRLTYGLRHSLRLRSRGERQFIADLKDCDVLVYCGGGYLNDSYDMSLLLKIMEISLDTDIPHMAYAHSIGPITRPGTASGLKQVLNRFSLVTVRDAASMAMLERIGVQKERVELLADAALAMHVEDGTTMSEGDRAALRAIEDFKRRQARPLVFMSVRSWRFPGEADAARHTERLNEQLELLVKNILTNTDWAICFVSTCQGRPEYTYDDSTVARRMVSKLGNEQSRVMVSEHAFGPRTFPYLIRTCADLVVSMRMHLTIFSLLAGVPFVAIAYERKSVEFCRMLGVDEFCHEAQTLDAGKACESAIELYGQRSAVADHLQRRRDQLIELSRRNAVLLAQRCLEKSSRLRSVQLLERGA